MMQMQSQGSKQTRQIQQILNHRSLHQGKGQTLYEVKWLGSAASDNCWLNDKEIQQLGATEYQKLLPYKRELKISRQREMRRLYWKKKKMKSNKDHKALSHKGLIQSEQSKASIRLIPAEEFKIHIKTDHKPCNHWLFGDKVAQILSKTKKQPQYQVRWTNGNTTTESQSELLQHETLLLCNFFETKILP